MFEPLRLSVVVHLLAPRTAILPDVPARIKTLLFPHFPDFLGGDTLVVTIIPLSDVLGDFDLRLAGQSLAIFLAMGGPGQWVLESEVQELKCALCSLSRGDVSAGMR